MQQSESKSNLAPPRLGGDFQSDFFKPTRFAGLLALLIFAMFPQVLLGLQTFVVRDFGFFAYPLAHYQRECFWRGELPFWNPYNSCGVPFLAQWNTMPLYPPALIYLLLPLSWSLSFFCLSHLCFAGFGAYFLARRWTGNDFAAAFAGVAFAFNGLTLNLLMWPSHIATFAWMPWVVLMVERAWREGGRTIFAAAFVGAMQMLGGGPETILFTWLLLTAIWVVEIARGSRELGGQRRAVISRFPFIVLLVAGLAAAQLLPFLDLAAHSQRDTGYADTRWSMPGWGWVNFLVPLAFGHASSMGVFFQYDQQWTSSYYLGTGALLLGVLAAWGAREWRVRLLAAAAGVALVLAFGDQTFISHGLRKIIPQLSLMTYPVKYVLLVTFIVPLLAAFALARLQASRSDPSPAPRRTRNESRLLLLGVVLLALIVAILAWASRIPFPTDDVRATLLNGLTRAGFLIATLVLLIAISRMTKPSVRRFAPLLLILVAWLDVLTHEPNQNPSVAPWIYEPGLARIKLAMKPQPALGESRAMVTPTAEMKFMQFTVSKPADNFIVKRLGYFADCNLLDGVPKVNGFFSLYPREWGELNSVLYGSTNAYFPGLLDFLGVSQIIAPGKFFEWEARTNFLPLVTAGQVPVFSDDTNALRSVIRPDFDATKIVFLPPEAKSLVSVTYRTFARVKDWHLTAQHLDFEASAAAPSLLVVAQTYYHRWRAYVDGKPRSLLRADYAFQAVEVPAGNHKVHLAYEDRPFQIGALISGFSWLTCAAACMRRKRSDPVNRDI